MAQEPSRPADLSRIKGKDVPPTEEADELTASALNVEKPKRRRSPADLVRAENEADMESAQAEHTRELEKNDSELARRKDWMTFLAFYIGVIVIAIATVVGLVGSFVTQGFTPTNMEILKAAAIAMITGFAGYFFGKAKSESSSR